MASSAKRSRGKGHQEATEGRTGEGGERGETQNKRVKREENGKSSERKRKGVWREDGRTEAAAEQTTGLEGLGSTCTAALRRGAYIRVPVTRHPDP